MMKRMIGMATVAAFLATVAPSLALARGADDHVRPHPQKPERPQKPHFARRADDLKPQLPTKPQRPERPHFAAKGVAAPKPAVNPKQQFGKGGIRVAARSLPTPKPAVNPKQQFGKGGIRTA